MVFEIERPALTLACREIDRWIADANAAVSAPPDPSEPPSKGMILVVDDEPEIGPLAQDILVPDGYSVLSTTDPLEAIRMLHDRSCVSDLLLVDVVMPVMGGRELARRLFRVAARDEGRTHVRLRGGRDHGVRVAVSPQTFRRPGPFRRRIASARGADLAILPMSDQTALRASARSAIQDGRVPSTRPKPVWGGPGAGETCPVCQQTLTRNEYEIEFDRPGTSGDGTLHLHVPCFIACEEEWSSA